MALEIIYFIELIVAYVVPLYFANAAPIIFHGKKPVDFGKKIGNKRILGDGKTILGALFGIVVGSFCGILIYLIFPEIQIISSNYILLAFLLSAGAILGDIVKSFFKRRVGIKSGEKWFLVDQLDFIIGGLVLSSFFRLPEIELIVFLFVVTVFVHTATNIAAFKLKLKKVPW